MVRVRFAPSPTGALHIGAARTCFFNWLFARHHKGRFLLRIEDTDVARSSEAMTEGILEGLWWLGLDWDEEPVFQSRRIAVYREKAEELVQKGAAYPCYCTPEEIRQRIQRTPEAGDFWGYDRACAHLTEEERRQKEAEGRSRAVRFRVPDGETRYKDVIHGSIRIDNRTLEDFVLLRSDGLPTYHLSVVVDDMAQGISHVIRGDDHISNTPKQILLYRAFGVEPPMFAHLPLILGPDKKKLSKRHGVTSVLEFRDRGYLPLAFLNFLAQMSWSPGEERIYSLEEMTQAFSLEKVSRGSPVYDQKKLDWLNGKLISRMKAEDLAPLVKREFEREGLWREEFAAEKRAWFLRLLDLLKERSRTIRAFPAAARPYLEDRVEMNPEGEARYLSDERLPALLPKLRADLSGLEAFSAGAVEEVLRTRAEKEGVKAALLIHALRMIVVGEPVSPGIFDVLELVGKEKTLGRIDQYLQKKNPQGSPLSGRG